MTGKTRFKQAFRRGLFTNVLLGSFVKKYQIESELAVNAWNIIAAAQKITLLAHLRPDPDSLGACSALALLFIDMGKEVEIIYPTSTIDPLPFTVPHLKVGAHTQQPDLIISCDASTDERVYMPDDFVGVPRIIIDHHLNNKMEGIQRFVYTDASSTCEIVYGLFDLWQQKVTPTIANILLFGILCDTLTFRTPNTTPLTLQIAGSLIDKGADMAKLNQQMIVHNNPAILQLWGEMLSHCQHTPDNTAVWVVCTQQMLRTYELDDQALVGFISMLSQTINSDITILFCELPDGTSKASLRGKKADVRSIATQFGGGGHMLAAGITSELAISELIKQVVEKL